MDDDSLPSLTSASELSLDQQTTNTQQRQFKKAGSTQRSIRSIVKPTNTSSLFRFNSSNNNNNNTNTSLGYINDNDYTSWAINPFKLSMKMPSNGNIAAASSAPLIIDSSAIIYSSDNYNNNINKSPTSTSINEINSNSYNLGAKSLQQQAGPHGQNKSNGSIDMKQPQPTHNAHHHRRNKSSVDILGCSEFGHVRKGYYQDVPVAVKTLNLPTEVDPLVSIEIFIYEAKKLKEFNHARIVNFIGFIVDTYSIVMEYIPMGTLREYITRHHQSLNLSPTAATGISSLIISSNDINPHTSPSSLNWMEKYTIALDIADAMDYFHSAPMMQDNRGALHQNLKSSNVMLVSENGRIRAKVSDFGLSVLIDAQLSRYIQDPNTYKSIYLAPEILKTKKFSKSCDVFSYGVVLYELFTMTTHLTKIGIEVLMEMKKQHHHHHLQPTSTSKSNQCTAAKTTLFEIAIACLDVFPENRPSFSTVTHDLREIKESDLQALVMDEQLTTDQAEDGQPGGSNRNNNHNASRMMFGKSANGLSSSSAAAAAAAAATTTTNTSSTKLYEKSSSSCFKCVIV